MQAATVHRWGSLPWRSRKAGVFPPYWLGPLLGVSSQVILTCPASACHRPRMHLLVGNCR